jgi:hypothetical protein
MLSSKRQDSAKDARVRDVEAYFAVALAAACLARSLIA